MERYKLFSRQSVSRLQIFCGGGLPDWIDFGFFKERKYTAPVSCLHDVLYSFQREKK